MVLLHLHCPSGASLRSLSHFLQLIRHSSRQLQCPSCHLVHFFLRYASLHHVRSLPICCKAGHPICFTHSLTHGNAPAFTQAIPAILTGFHFASLRHPFTSVAFSPPAANNLACLAACHGCGFVMVFVHTHIALTKTKTHAKPLRLTVAVYRRFTAF